jgi:hypothetical protein
MRHTLGILVATTTLLLAAGCGSNDGNAESASDQTAPTPTATSSGKPPSTAEVVAILSGTGAGGDMSKAAVDVGSPAGLDLLVSELRSTGFGDQVRAKVAATDVPDGRTLMGAIVNVGCDVPTGVVVTGGAGGAHLPPTFTGKPLQECLVAVTSVALVLVEA